MAPTEARAATAAAIMIFRISFSSFVSFTSRHVSNGFE
jgi:hypothetical protein